MHIQTSCLYLILLMVECSCAKIDFCNCKYFMVFCIGFLLIIYSVIWHSQFYSLWTRRQGTMSYEPQYYQQPHHAQYSPPGFVSFQSSGPLRKPSQQQTQRQFAPIRQQNPRRPMNQYQQNADVSEASSSPAKQTQMQQQPSDV